MVSFLISEIGKLIDGHSPEAMYARLKKRGFLSEAALVGSRAVILTLERASDTWPANPVDGAELWRSMQSALIDGGYLSAAGVEAAERYVSRR